MTRAALLDRRTLLLDQGALVAGWPDRWRYVWPRDAAFGVAALAACGHPDDAAAVLGLLSRVQPLSGLFQARYLPDGSGPPDRRGVQLDGSGWALWAAGQLARRTAPDRQPTVLPPLRPLLDRSVDAVAGSLYPGTGLPPAGADYSEVAESALTLGVAAPLLAGLETAVAVYDLLGDPAAAGRAGGSADLLPGGIRTAFAPATAATRAGRTATPRSPSCWPRSAPHRNPGWPAGCPGWPGGCAGRPAAWRRQRLEAGRGELDAAGLAGPAPRPVRRAAGER